MVLNEGDCSNGGGLGGGDALEHVVDDLDALGLGVLVGHGDGIHPLGTAEVVGTALEELFTSLPVVVVFSDTLGSVLSVGIPDRKRGIDTRGRVLEQSFYLWKKRRILTKVILFPLPGNFSKHSRESSWTRSWSVSKSTISR